MYILERNFMSGAKTFFLEKSLDECKQLVYDLADDGHGLGIRLLDMNGKIILEKQLTNVQ